MPFVLKGKLVGRQGANLQPAIAAVTVVAVAGMVLAISPSSALRTKVQDSSPRDVGVHAAARTVAKSPSNGGLPNPPASKHGLAHPASTFVAPVPAAAVQDARTPQEVQSAQRISPVRQRQESSPSGPAQLELTVVPAAPPELKDSVPTPALTSSALAVSTPDAAPETGLGGEVPPTGNTSAAAATIERPSLSEQAVTAVMPAPLPVDVVTAAQRPLVASVRMPNGQVPAVSADALQWIISGTVEDDDRIFNRQPSDARLADNDTSLTGDTDSNPAASLQAVRARVEEGIAKRTERDAKVGAGPDTTHDPVALAENLAMDKRGEPLGGMVEAARTAPTPGYDNANLDPSEELVRERPATVAPREQALSQLVVISQDALARSAHQDGKTRSERRTTDASDEVLQADDPVDVAPVAASYKQTSAGVEVTLPLRVHGARAGSVTLLIAGATAGHADVVHKEFRISLASVLDALRPDMDPVTYARLRSSPNADELVTLNDLRAVGLTVGFDKNGNLTLG
ncbi:hypothetical protein [Novosphingobium album (ex Hu et al. 2023)]|uniref:Flagellar hook-length control protein FliK n=1 Tax=Novosphingobium album (ex Hu et al. 2023) TaxID=2930093 RepID=A0ABT0B4B0_9SPHN|nr:hypothetical protein [Novosphingobium album (ex Hu et al. 2023)]MCJ2179654.1 hypothetical protein [Novosphingobium album (ex Hu et al. 2023)]